MSYSSNCKTGADNTDLALGSVTFSQLIGRKCILSLLKSYRNYLETEMKLQYYEIRSSKEHSSAYGKSRLRGGYLILGVLPNPVRIPLDYYIDCKEGEIRCLEN